MATSFKALSGRLKIDRLASGYRHLRLEGMRMRMREKGLNRSAEGPLKIGSSVRGDCALKRKTQDDSSFSYPHYANCAYDACAAGHCRRPPLSPPPFFQIILLTICCMRVLLDQRCYLWEYILLVSPAALLMSWP